MVVPAIADILRPPPSIHAPYGHKETIARVGKGNVELPTLLTFVHSNAVATASAGSKSDFGAQLNTQANLLLGRNISLYIGSTGSLYERLKKLFEMFFPRLEAQGRAKSACGVGRHVEVRFGGLNIYSNLNKLDIQSLVCQPGLGTNSASLARIFGQEGYSYLLNSQSKVLRFFAPVQFFVGRIVGRMRTFGLGLVDGWRWGSGGQGEEWARVLRVLGRGVGGGMFGMDGTVVKLGDQGLLI